MSKYQRTKGRRGEQECVKFWRDIFPEAKRHLEFQSCNAVEGIDVILNEQFQVQVKTGNQAPIKIYKWLEQIKQKEGKIRFLQMKRDRGEWVVVIKAKDFMKIIKKYEKIFKLQRTTRRYVRTGKN